MFPVRLSLAGAAAATVTMVAATAAGGATPAAPAGVDPNTDGAATSASVDTGSAIVQLAAAPLSTAPRTHPAQGKKIDFSSAAVKSQRALLAKQRNDFKAWLKNNAPKAKVTGEYDISLNAVAVKLNGTPLSAIAAAPGVTAASYEGLYHPTADATDPDLPLIKAFDAWGGNTDHAAAKAGAGVKVAIIDTGIDVTNPCFYDDGFDPTKQIGPAALTNNKVIVAKVFYNKAKVNGLTPAAVQEHGTHVSGTVACDYHTPAPVDGVSTYEMSGVAPAAQLGNYNIFPGDVTNARSEDILDALEAAYSDGMDVANLSLGGNANGSQDLLTHAIDDLDRANMVVAVAAGNSGPGHYTVESPGSAARALTAGASSVGQFVGATLGVDGSTIGLASGDFPTVTNSLTAPLGVVTGAVNGLSDACTGITDDLTGEIAVVSRGTCSFSVKIRNAESAGAVAAIIVNNVAGTPTAMATDGTPNQPDIPAYMAALSAAGPLVGAAGHDATIDGNLSYVQSPKDDNIMAGFSSQGPTDVDFRVKPDVVAPGVNVLSSIPGQFCDAAPCFTFMQGTSMATPHLAGSAAVVRGQHQNWSAAQIRSAIVNTAQQGVLTDSQTGSTPVTDPNIVGAGLDDLAAAVHAAVGLDPVSTSFGAVPSGSGQTRTATVTVSDLTGSGGTYQLGLADSPASGGVAFSAPSSVTVPAGGSASVTVTMTASKGAALGDHYATLTVGRDGTQVAHAVVYTFVK